MLNDLTMKKEIKTRSVSPENFSGEKGKGGMAAEGTASSCARDLGIGWKISPFISIEPGKTEIIGDIHAMGAIKHIWLTDSCKMNRGLILRIYWEDSPFPSVETPINDFFACADSRGYTPLNSIAVCVNPAKGFNSYWEMPFKKHFKITVENISDETVNLYYQIDYEEKEISDDCLYFHSQFRRVNPLPYKEVYTILDNVHGKGHYVGTYLFWGTNNNGWWGEGEIKFYLDGDREYPTICGTRTEDYFCGSWNFDVAGHYQEYSTMYSGLSKVIKGDGLYASQQRFSMYRWHICDPIYFDEDIKVTIQALGGEAKADICRFRKIFRPLHFGIRTVFVRLSPNCRMPTVWRLFKVNIFKIKKHRESSLLKSRA